MKGGAGYTFIREASGVTIVTLRRSALLLILANPGPTAREGTGDGDECSGHSEDNNMEQWGKQHEVVTAWNSVEILSEE